MARFGLALLISTVFIFALACVSDPQVVEEEPPVVPAAPAQITSPPVQNPRPPIQPPPQGEVFDPNNVSQERYLSTKSDIQALVVELNRIIRAKNYTAWLGYLSDSFLGLMNSTDFLDEKTEDLYKRDQIVAANSGKDPRAIKKRQLKTPRDYFDNIVVPSRSNDRVDDIAFISETTVRAYTLDTRGNRLILYELAIIDGKWKIVG